MQMRSHSNGGLLRLEDILPFLQGVKKKASGHVTATCPLCNKPDHFHVDQKGEQLLCFCQRCNAKGDEFFAEFRRLGAKPSVVDEPAIDYKRTAPVEDYKHVYRNPDGSVAYYKRRQKWSDGHKIFSFSHEANGRTVYTKPEGCNNLYNLDLLAKHETDTLYIVEGEKCADAMVKAGLLATTSNTGAQKNVKLTLVDRQMLDSYKNIVVIPDNDEKGLQYAEAWPMARVLDLSNIWLGCPKKADVADFLAQGGDVNLIKNYIFPEVLKLDDEYLMWLDRYQIVDVKFLEAIAKVREPMERQHILSMVGIRAGELGVKREFDRCWKAFLQSLASKGVVSNNMTDFPGHPLQLRCGEWTAGMTGVFKKVQVGTEFKDVFASPIPIMATEILRNVEDDTERIKLEFFKDGRWRSVTVPRSKVANKNRILDLADFGIEVNSDNAGMLVRYIADLVALNQDILPKCKTIDHMGWYENKFIPYTDEIKLDCEEQYKSLMLSVAEKGTLEEWVAYVAPLRKNIYLRLIMATAFASPLLEKVGALNFVLHLWGGTGSGKTVAAMVAASVWGNPAFGKLVRTMNMTVNSMMNMSALLRNLPFFGDELQTIKSKFENYDSLIMRVCEGVDRGRMTNAVLQKQKVWNNVFIFTGEDPCTKSISGGGVKNRVIEVECNEKIIDDGNAVVNYVTAHYGCAGKVFVEGLNVAELVKDYQECKKLLIESTQTTEKQAMAMALILLADWRARKLFWPEEPMLGVEDVMMFLKSKAEVDVTERAYQFIVNLIAENRAKFDDDWSDAGGHACWGKFRNDGTVVINKAVLEREMETAGFDFNACKRKWAERGYLVPTKQGKHIHKLSIAKVICWTIILKYDAIR